MSNSGGRVTAAASANEQECYTSEKSIKIRNTAQQLRPHLSLLLQKKMIASCAMIFLTIYTE